MDGPVQGLPTGRVRPQQQRPGQVMTHGVHGVERGEGVLEDQLDFVPVGAQGPAAAGRGLAVEQDLPGHPALQLSQGPDYGGFAAAALTDQGEGLAGPEGEGQVVHRPESRPAPLAEFDRQARNLQHAHVSPPALSAAPTGSEWA